MSLNDILITDTGRQQRRRVGRGLGSGIGKTGGRGSKGEGSRTGGKNRGPLFEGGQFPFWMRLPKRGFSNHEHKVTYQTIDLARALKRVKGKELTLETLETAGLINAGTRVKIVGGRAEGAVKVERAVSIVVNRVSGPVKAAIEAAGGTIKELDLEAAPKDAQA
ncbi:MAG: 50S ribosomal protein L15 [Planctomycetes bacterium]|nr:50S ribosomal protein L15 [Planctomycetota bacterium]